jgi:hypothetical protein
MRKIYWRRFFLSSFLLCLTSTSALMLITIFRSKQENIVSVLYDPRADCLQAEKDRVVEPFTIPPHYLVVPYREFVLRTSISCRAFKLDNPRENVANFHAKHSKYLRGAFPFVVPYANITFPDVENFYNKILPTKPNETAGIQTSFAPEIKFEHIPYRYKDRMWSPIQVKSAQRTALLVPLQGRDYNAKAFLLNMHAFARRQQLTYTIVLIEQVNSHFSHKRKTDIICVMEDCIAWILSISNTNIISVAHFNINDSILVERKNRFNIDKQ